MDQPTAAASVASVASAGTAVLWATGQPPDALLLAALAGGVLSLWGDPPPSRISVGWVVAAVGRLLMSVCVGLAGAAALPAIAAGYDALRPLAAAPQWVVSGVCSLLAPVIVNTARTWLAARSMPAAVPLERKP